MNSGNKINFEEKIRQGWSVPPMPEGSDVRFAKRLEQEFVARQRRKLGVWITVASIAAAVVLMVSVWSHKEVPTVTDDYAGEIALVKRYYESKQWEETEYIAMITKDMEDSLREQIMTEVMAVRQKSDSTVHEIMASMLPNDQKIYNMIIVYSPALNTLARMREIMSNYTKYETMYKSIENGGE